MNRRIEDVLQDLREQKKTGALFITVEQSKDCLLRLWFVEGEILRFSYGPLDGKDCLDLLDSYDYGKAVFLEGMTSLCAADVDHPQTESAITFFLSAEKTVEVLQSQWWPANVTPLPTDEAMEAAPRLLVPNMEWTKDLSVDVPLIDDQHKEIFSKIDALVKAWAGGRGGAEVETIIRFLEGHILTHFRTEEQYMIKYAYANRLVHMGQHEEFMQSFGNLKARYYCHGADDDLIAETVDLIVDWYRNHVRYTDRAFGLFLKVNMYNWTVA